MPAPDGMMHKPKVSSWSELSKILKKKSFSSQQNTIHSL